MKILLGLLLALAPVVSSGQTAEKLTPVRHDFVIKNFRTESGVTLPEVHVIYGTYGHLNAAKDNVVLLPSHYMAKFKGYEWLMGPGKALDPDKLFLVCTELFANGSSSSPSNTAEPFHGSHFPLMTIRDNVNAGHQLLIEELKVQHLKAVIGFSMGAQQAFQWAVSYPTFMDRAVATSGTSKTYPHGIVRLEGQIAAITTDPVYNNGDYTAEPLKGIEDFGTMWMGWLYSQEWWHEELWRATAKPGTTFAQYFEQRRTHFITGDANDIIAQMRTWESNDVGASPGFGKLDFSSKYGGNIGEASTNPATERALGSIKVPFLYMPSATDMYFPITDATYEAKFIPGVTFMPIPSLWGHPAGAAADPADAKFLNENIARFLSGQLAPTSLTK
ncbi:alpha/beta fold hydrolase [Granulicella arctica]|uniref:alpha/beta fold hydrolase n=1 Tax=Granulicella arctica TaxID=940613 RepID=UPI0021DF774D|nr:alpha/beta fold hydrolase [Granulicella arctica]